VTLPAFEGRSQRLKGRSMSGLSFIRVLGGQAGLRVLSYLRVAAKHWRVAKSILTFTGVQFDER
jgi:hypothetical protein